MNDAQNPQSPPPAEAEPSRAEAAPSKTETPPSDAARSAAEAQPSAEVSALAAELEKTRAELDKTQQELARAAARLDEITRAYSSQINEQREFRGRMEREKERVLAVERGKVAIALLEVGDELDRALAADGAESPLGKGVRMIQDGLMRRLQAMGIERLSLVGRPFDPNLAEAVDLVPVDDAGKADVVVSEDVPGYKLGDRILRPARVRVARYVPAAAPPPPSQPDGGAA